MTIVSLALLAAACGEAASTAAAGSETPAPQETEGAEGGTKRFDELTLELELAATTVTAGEDVDAYLHIRNESNENVTDPSCYLSGVSFGLVPVDDPDGELWQAIVVDCNGPRTMQPGFAERYSSTTFQTTTKYGDPLPPGDYLAAMEIRGLSERLTAPITLTE